MNAQPLKDRPYGVVIPAYQAELTLPAVLRDLQGRMARHNILVIDDGSNDGTTAAAQSLGVSVLRHPENRGKGSALMSGLSQAGELGWQWVLTVDADGQHAGADLDRLLEFVPGERTGIIVGRRRLRGAMPWHRRFSNGFSTWLVSRAAGKPVYDAQCGLRAYRTELTHRFPRTGRFEWEAQALVLCSRAGYDIEAVPVQTRYTGSGSHMRLGRDTWRFLRMLRSTAWML